jgi:hypothetical protein
MVVVSFCKNRAPRRRLVTQVTSLVAGSKYVAILASVDNNQKKKCSDRFRAFFLRGRQ